MTDLKDKLIVQYMGSPQLLKSVDILDHNRQRSNGSLGQFYNFYYKELTSIDQVITGGEAVCAFVKALGARGSDLYDSLRVKLVTTVEEMRTSVKLYIDLEIANEDMKGHKDSKSEIYEEEKSEQRSHKNYHEDQCRPLVSRPNREVYETYTHLKQKISVILNEMEIRDWALPPDPQKNGLGITAGITAAKATTSTTVKSANGKSKP